MGNYRNKADFIERTLGLIAQYESLMHRYEFEQQYNHTLLINSLLGLIVLPKENAISYLPEERLTQELNTLMGIDESNYNPEITTLKSLIIALRHSIAHFDISFESKDESFFIDRIIFKDEVKKRGYVVATFVPNELLSFIRYYTSWLLTNMRNYGFELE